MRLIRGDYEEAKKVAKEAVCSGSFSVDQVLDKCRFADLSVMETVRLYSELKCIFDTSMVVSINVSTYDAQNIYTGSTVDLNRFFDRKVVDKMLKKFGSDPKEELGMNKTLDLGRLMLAGKSVTEK